MKKWLWMTVMGVLSVGLSACVCHGNPDPTLRKANSTILQGASLQTAQGTLPVANPYRRLPGCYIACYSHNPTGSGYSVGHQIYVKGLVRVSGLYLDRNCQPQGYFFKDLSALPYFTAICSKQLPACKKGSCWAGGDTGGFLGISQ